MVKKPKDYGIIAEGCIESEIVQSEVFQNNLSFNSNPTGRPEKILGVHIGKILDFIEGQGWDRYRPNLRLMALLHDIGKPYVKRSLSGNVVGLGHTRISEQIAEDFLDDASVLRLIVIHDRYKHFFDDCACGRLNLEKFARVYRGADLDTLARFHYADSNDRSKDSSKWVDDKFVELGLREGAPVYATDFIVLP